MRLLLNMAVGLFGAFHISSSHQLLDRISQTAVIIMGVFIFRFDTPLRADTLLYDLIASRDLLLLSLHHNLS